MLGIFGLLEFSKTTKYKVKNKQKLENPIEDHTLRSVIMKHVKTYIWCSKNTISVFGGSFNLNVIVRMLFYPHEAQTKWRLKPVT